MKNGQFIKKVDYKENEYLFIKKMIKSLKNNKFEKITIKCGDIEIKIE